MNGGPTEAIRHSRAFSAAFDEAHLHHSARNETSRYALFRARWLGSMGLEPNLVEDETRVQTGDRPFDACMLIDIWQDNAHA